MKKFILSALIVLFALQLPASSIVSVKDHNDLVRTIRQQLHFSEKVKKEAQGASAIVTFVVNDHGAVEIKEIISDSKAAKEAIEKQMKNMPIYKTPVLPNTLYTMKVSFTQQ